MNQTVWSWKEFTLLVGFALVFVPIVIDWLLEDWLQLLLSDDLFRGTLVGLILSILFMLLTYFIALKPHQLSWQEVGVRSMRKSHWKLVMLWSLLTILIGILYIIALELLGFGTDNSKTESLETNKSLMAFIIAFL